MTPSIRSRLLASLAAALAITAPASAAYAWGATGHRIIGRLGVLSLPESLPAFVRSPAAAEAVGELAREPDRWRGAGKTHDSSRDGGHFVDVDDDGKVLGGPALSALPATRSDYETAIRAAAFLGAPPSSTGLERALRAADSKADHAGWLPYSIIDGWQQLAKDFTYWRVLSVAVERERDSGRKAWLVADLKRREDLTIRDLGVWAHYVGDGSQPLHVSVHFNGWGDFPNPNAYTRERVHVPFEGAFVRQWVSEDAVRAAMPEPRACSGIETCTGQYLTETFHTVIPFYELQKAGGLAGPRPQGRSFAVERVAAGAAELRDLIVSAWEASASGSLGYPPLTVDQVVKEHVDPWDALYGDD